MLLTADRPTTSRWAPLRGERSYQVRPILDGKNRGRHFVRKTPSPGSQIAFESGLGSAFEPTPAIACADSGSEHRDRLASYVACRTMLPSAESGRGCRGIGAYQRNIFPARLTALKPRARRDWSGQGWRFGGLDAIEHESLDWAGHVRRGQHGTRAMCGCTAARRSDQLKICCADDSTIGNAVFLEAAVSTQAGRCAFALSAVRNIVLRAA